MSILRLGLCFTPGVLGSAGPRRRLASCHVLLFPELSDGGYAALARGAAPHLPSDNYFRPFRSISREGNLTCIAGSASVRSEHGRRTNTSVVYSSGREIHRYDKIHLFRPSGDHRFFSPGRSLATFPVTIGRRRLRAGVIVCYDLRFPEMVRLMAVRGMQILFVPARWPAERDDAWHTLLKARALENQIFVAGCNAPDREGGFSYVFDPLGRCVWSNRKRREGQCATVDLNLDRLQESRRLHQNLRDARLLRQLQLPSGFTFHAPPR